VAVRKSEAAPAQAREEARAAAGPRMWRGGREGGAGAQVRWSERARGMLGQRRRRAAAAVAAAAAAAALTGQR